MEYFLSEKVTKLKQMAGIKNMLFFYLLYFMRNTALEIEAIENPQDLPDSVIREIQFTSQDIWSRVDSL